MRGYLVLLVLSLVVPGSIFAGVLFWRYYHSEVARIEHDLQNDARQLASTVDRDLAGLQSTLQTLSASTRLPLRDYAAFYQQAAQVRDLIGVDILLRDLAGQQLVNTRVAWGTQLPKEPLPGDREVIDTRRPAISGVMIGTLAQKPVFTLTAPVVERGRVTHLLNLSVPPERYIELLQKNLELGRRAGIVDPKGLVLARTGDSADRIGEPAVAGFIENARGVAGIWRGLSFSETPVLAAYARSQLAGWVVYVNVEATQVRRSLLELIGTLAALAVVLTSGAVLIAYSVGGRLAGSVRVLAAQAAALGRGEPIDSRRLPVHEFSEVGQALVSASDRIREREGERDTAIGDLRRVSESLETKVAERTRDLVDEMQRRVRAEEVMRQAQKMEAVGQLTGGVAHDFNNMLAVILGSLDLALRRLARGDTTIQKYLVNAQEGGRRAAALTQRLLAFSRQQPLDPEPIEPNRLVAGMSDLLRRSLGEAIQLETVLAGGLWRTHTDRNQLENAILNLAVNARDAMQGGGKLTIETANAHLDDAYAVRHVGVSSGQYVLIAVTDTGTGMTPEVLEKAFDPFYTTKQSGAGTGLGLSQVYGFVRQSGGHIAIYSEVSHGTAVKIYLPRFIGEEPTKEVEADSLVPPPANDGSVTVLIVEDEEGVRAHVTDAFQELGYRILAAANGTEALNLLDAHPQIGLLFTDVVMPDMNGRKLAEEAKKRRPSLKVLFTTGYTRNAIVHNGMLDHGVQLITKPFSLDQLARKVMDVLRS